MLDLPRIHCQSVPTSFRWLLGQTEGIGYRQKNIILWHRWIFEPGSTLKFYASPQVLESHRVPCFRVHFPPQVVNYIIITMGTVPQLTYTTRRFSWEGNGMSCKLFSSPKMHWTSKPNSDSPNFQSHSIVLCCPPSWNPYWHSIQSSFLLVKHVTPTGILHFFPATNATRCSRLAHHDSSTPLPRRVFP